MATKTIYRLPDDSLICTGTSTNSGEPCKRLGVYVVGGKRYCAAHNPLRPNKAVVRRSPRRIQEVESPVADVAHIREIMRRARAYDAMVKQIHAEPHGTYTGGSILVFLETVE